MTAPAFWLLAGLGLAVLIGGIAALSGRARMPSELWGEDTGDWW